MGVFALREFHIRFRSFRDVYDFVSLASRQQVKLLVGGDRFQVNATSFMGMFALNCRKIQRVCVECSEEELNALLVTFDRFLVK